MYEVLQKKVIQTQVFCQNVKTFKTAATLKQNKQTNAARPTFPPFPPICSNQCAAD